MRKHFCGHTSNTSDFKTSSFQEASVWSWYYHSCSVISLKMISDWGFDFFIWSLRIALYKYKAFHVLNKNIAEQQEVVFQVMCSCVCNPERRNEWPESLLTSLCFLTSASSNTNTNKHRVREGPHWSVVATHKHTQWVCLDVFPVLSSHDTLSAHASTMPS